jgi:hypothetical protein
MRQDAIVRCKSFLQHMCDTSAPLSFAAGNIHRDGKSCLRHYSATWMAIDLVAVIPFDTIISEALAATGQTTNSQTLRILAMTRTPRLLRLTKVHNLLGIRFRVAQAMYMSLWFSINVCPSLALPDSCTAIA